MKKSKKSPLFSTTNMIVSHAVLVFFLLVSILPIYWMWQASLAPPAALAQDPFAIPSSITFQNLIQAWTVGRMNVYMLNSIYVAFPRVIVVLTLASMAGYAFGKLDFWGRDKIFYFFLFGMMVPFQAMLIPLYYNIQRMGLINTRFGVILPYFGLSMPFAIFMMRSFFRNLPNELMESAKIDGCNAFTAFLFIMLPLVKPAVASLFIFEFLGSWNDFLLPMMMIHNEEHRTLPLGMMHFQGRFSRNISLIAAGITISTVPIIALYIALQRKFIEGLTSGAIKG